MKLLRIGMKDSEDVRKWQFFLIGQELLFTEADGNFGEATLIATISFQKKYNLEPDGIVGNKTLGMASVVANFNIVIDNGMGRNSANFPPKPSFKSLNGTTERQKIFGKFDYIHKPLNDNPENIEITGDWEKNNITVVNIPQLVSIKSNGNVRFHQKAAKQLQDLWTAWEKHNLLHLVLSWHGSYNPRFIRGSKSTLSNHAFGTAFDINYDWNRLGVLPALVGQKGSVRELVGIANDHGFFWGGHFDTRFDGMHFEVAEIK